MHYTPRLGVLLRTHCCSTTRQSRRNRNPSRCAKCWWSWTEHVCGRRIGKDDAFVLKCVTSLHNASCSETQRQMTHLWRNSTLRDVFQVRQGERLHSRNADTRCARRTRLHAQRVCAQSLRPRRHCVAGARAAGGAATRFIRSAQRTLARLVNGLWVRIRPETRSDT